MKKGFSGSRYRRKKPIEKRGYMRYSSGPKWRYRYLPTSPSYYYHLMPKRLRNIDNVLPSGYTVTQTWVALSKSWNGYIIAKQNGDMENIKKYVGQIRKLQKELGFEQTTFDDFSQEELDEIDLENDEDFLMERYGTMIY